MTLTLRADDKKSPRQLADVIKRAFPKLIHAIRKDLGPIEYMMVFELTKIGTPHVHVLTRGPYISKGWLSRKWAELTGAFVVDIRKIRHQGDVARYITKYLGKAIAQASSVLHGLRIIQRSKHWIIDQTKIHKSDADQSDYEITDWTFVRATPRAILQLPTLSKNYTVAIESKTDCLVLRGPPTPGVVDWLVYPYNLSERARQDLRKTP